MAGDAPVGIVGIGLTGEVYARRLIAAGFAVIGFDIEGQQHRHRGNTPPGFIALGRQ
jgi:phosphoglycerate dehydrogenase-like enzyme